MSVIQLKGNLALAPEGETPLIDVKDYVSAFILHTTRELVTVPATLGLDAYQEAGATNDSLEIKFHSGIEPAGLWATLYEAIRTPSAKIDWEGTFDPGVVSASNMEWSGTAVLPSLDTGGTVASLREQTITLPIVAGTLATSSTP